MKAYVSALLLLLSARALAFDVQILEINSDSMDISHKATLVLPDSYTEGDRRYPVLYLLHGHGGNYQNWAERTDVEALADKHQMLIVMPDGNIDSWYLDSAVKANSQYQRYIGEEIPAFIDRQYRTVAERNGRAITGLSMGGFGALNVALAYPQHFIAAGSTSGGVDPRGFEGKWGLNEVLGDPVVNQQAWMQKAIVNRLAVLKQHQLGLIVDCGVDDFFLAANRRLHQALLDAGIAHTYIEQPGGHNWPYWAGSIVYQAEFFSRYLSKSGQTEQVSNH
ncbi:alpha/beta hydrolase family protein [Bowmanella denitrificans]|uniref:Alpha/beta hydrolase family protein n=1 Tax=Bowmanella denitrificans TaxID=366582 RepID=A0ABP3GR43_9ALTE